MTGLLFQIAKYLIHFVGALQISKTLFRRIVVDTREFRKANGFVSRHLVAHTAQCRFLPHLAHSGRTGSRRELCPAVACNQ